MVPPAVLADRSHPGWTPMKRVYIALFPHRRVVQLLIDGAILFGALALAIALRYDLDPPADAWRHVLLTYPLAAAAQLLLGVYAGLYLGRWSFGSFEEVGALIRTLGCASVALTALNALVGPLPVTVPAITALVALIAMAGTRYTWRLAVERRQRPVPDEAQRLIVFGAGVAGTQMVTSLLRNRRSRYLPVALLDDDPRKQNLRIRGVPVVGDRNDLVAIARRLGADALLIAVPSGDGALVRDLSRLGSDAGLHVTLLPPVSELFDGKVDEEDIRGLTETDLLGRREISTDLASIAGYLVGRRVLVTGAGGSIGSELCRQIHRLGPESLVMLDRDESGLHATQLSIDGRALLDTRDLVVCDIRDAERLDRVFREHRPDVVFHAAALKHLTLLQHHPAEAVKTNVLGTRNVLEAAARWGAQRFVNISTDKAADPACVLGWSKRITERLTADVDARTPGQFLSVRFGNVLGSRGSVLTAFRRQIETGGPVTVTHPEVSRYFMTIEEAVQLVVQAGAIGHGGDVLVLDMGSPVKIADMARRLVEQAERPCDIVFTGLRSGEKLHETLFGGHEVRRTTEHPLISRVWVLPMRPALVARLDTRAEDADVVDALRSLAVDDHDDNLIDLDELLPEHMTERFAL
jgi:FlaA1/EpsC-like NDP-sugar epimerase